jgi:methyl-accepting chemotaxis protein
MNKIQYDNAGRELMQTIEIERLKLEASINSEIAIARRMADSPLIQRHFLDPEDEDMKQITLEEIAGYRRAFAGNNVFWISDTDKKYYFNDEYVYTINPSDESSWWYNSIMENPTPYIFNVNFDIGIKKTMLWINAPVFDNNQKPAGIVGTGINLSDFINAINHNYSGIEDKLYFFNSHGEIIKAKEVDLVEKKANITEVLGRTGDEILDRTKELEIGEIEYFKSKNKMQIIAVTAIPVSSVPALNWHITAVRHFTVVDSLKTNMSVLFGVMMAVIFSIFIFFNIFIAVMLEPLNQMVKTINQTFSDWDLKPQESKENKDEIETLGDFLHLTIIDQLTGIYNRRYLDGSLKKIIKLLSRAGGSLSVLMIDIDHFKKYNDAYGHDAGDECLRTVASVLSQCVIREDDFIARYGGEEFTVVLPNTDENGAYMITEKMLEKMRECNIPHETNDAADYVTVSIGAATGTINYLQNGSDYIKAADKALYESKRNGRNRCTFLKTA